MRVANAEGGACVPPRCAAKPGVGCSATDLGLGDAGATIEAHAPSTTRYPHSTLARRRATVARLPRVAHGPYNAPTDTRPRRPLLDNAPASPIDSRLPGEGADRCDARESTNREARIGLHRGTERLSLSSQEPSDGPHG